MRIVSRVILTVTGLSVLAVGWRAGEVPVTMPEASQVALPATAQSGSPSVPAPSAAPNTPATVAAPSASAAPAAPPAGPTGTFVGPAIPTRYGTLQVQVVVNDGKITTVEPLQTGATDSHSRGIASRAIPALVTEVLDAQTWDVHYVSGASYTSQGVLGSVEGALQDAGLA